MDHKVLVQRRHLMLYRALHMGDHRILERLRNSFCMRDNSVKADYDDHTQATYFGDYVLHSAKLIAFHCSVY